MRAFAEYFENDDLVYRTNTLLQFGDSWELIGNVVLANPGSADPVGTVELNEFAKISGFIRDYRGGEAASPEHWHEFSIDSTMRFVEKIFTGWYVGEKFELNGVIQFFNTFNIKNQNLEEAVSQISNGDGRIFSYGIQEYFNDKPTYFGFSNEVLLNEKLRKVAMSIFDNSSSVVRAIYDDDFAENSFYHPMFINKAYRQNHFQDFKKKILLAFVNQLNAIND